MQTNDYHQIGILIWNHTIKYELSDRNTWNYTTMCKLFVLNRNTRYNLIICFKNGYFKP